MIDLYNALKFITMLFFYTKDSNVQSRCCVFKVREYTTKAFPRRLEFMGIENLGASVTLLLRSYCTLATFQLR